MSGVPRRKPAPALSACAPRGSLAAPWFAGSICGGCGELVHPVHLGDNPEWSYADDAGRVVVDRWPPGYRDNPAQWWADLAKHNIGAYSVMRHLSDSQLGWVHFHRAGLTTPYALAGPERSTTEPGRQDPPFCHGSPMWAGPYGWVCRVAGYRSTPFPYTTAPESERVR